MRLCPWCSKEIEASLTQCPFCGKPVLAFSEKPKWYFNGFFIITGFLAAGPLVLPLIWRHPQYSRNKKVFLTLLVILVTWLIVHVLIRGILQISQYYQNIFDFAL
jgi:hypothetical protein